MKIVLLITVIMFGRLYAQTFFYIQPSISFKTSLCSSKTNSFSSEVLNPSNKFKVKPKNFIFPQQFSPLLLGFDLGMSFKKKYYFSFGFNQDESSSSVDIDFISYEPVFQNYDNNYYYFTGGRTFTRIVFDSKIQIIDKKKHKLFFNAGIGLAYKGKTSTNQTFSVSALLNSSSSYLNITYKISDNLNKSLLLHIGLSDDIYIKNNYIGTVCFFYSKSYKTLTTLRTSIEVKSDDENRIYNYHIISKGSGFYLKFSRKIKILPWRKTKKAHNKSNRCTNL